MKNILLLLLTLNSGLIFAQKNNIIPKPIKYQSYNDFFTIDNKTVIKSANESLNIYVLQMQDYFSKYYGIKLKPDNKSKSGYIELVFLKTNIYDKQGYYRISADKEKIIISGDKSGVFYGIQTLKQIVKLEKKEKLSVQCLEIEDYPDFKWRGMHLDCCRHFFSKDFIKQYLEFMSYYKMNVFHWHITDDQGWRIEIKKYPQLTNIGAYRDRTLSGHASDSPEKYDNTKYGGYYSQDDIKEIVAYANSLNITIVPEIEMPGHALAALAAYPEFSCTGGPFKVAEKWGVFDDVFCTKDETFQFVQNILDEVISLFPGEYIHIGGDECPKIRWASCPNCKEVMKKQNISNVNDLQAYFSNRILKYLALSGRKAIGWDEILDTNLSKDAAIMSWQGTEGGLKAAKLKHNVVMCPGSYCYFDHYQSTPKNEPLAIGGYTTIDKVYSFNPIPAGLTPEQQKYITGAQGNLWTEYISEPKDVEYMLFPRISALSEVLWNGKDRSYDEFKTRLVEHFKLLDLYKINYSKAIYEIKTSAQQNKKGVELTLTEDFPELEIYYTLDGSEPKISSARYSNPIIIDADKTVKATCYKNGVKFGNTIEQAFTVSNSTGKAIQLKNAPDESYNYGGSFTLVDGIIGKLPWYGKDWLGFKGTNCDAVIDLKKKQNISKVIVDVLKAEVSWIYLPKSIEIQVSDNNVNFTSLKIVDSEYIIRKGRSIDITVPVTKTRYVKIIVRNYGIIEAGKPGEGNPGWLFLDEIMIY
jgi:hexosaminidase